MITVRFSSGSGSLRRVHEWQFRARAHVVAMHRYIDDASVDISFLDLANESPRFGARSPRPAMEFPRAQCFRGSGFAR